MPKQSFAQETDAWRQLAGAVERHAQEMPHLEVQAAELAALVERVSKLRGRQRRLQTQLLVLTSELQSGLEEGRNLASRLRAGAKQVYGFHATKLTEFGARPRRKAKRRKGEAPGPDPAETPPS